MQHVIDKREYDEMELAARGHPLRPEVRDYRYMLCAFVQLNKRVEALEAQLAAKEIIDA